MKQNVPILLYYYYYYLLLLFIFFLFSVSSTRCKNSPPKKQWDSEPNILKNLSINQINQIFTRLGKPKFLKIS
jgi:hypothetical protein